VPLSFIEATPSAPNWQACAKTVRSSSATCSLSVSGVQHWRLDVAQSRASATRKRDVPRPLGRGSECQPTKSAFPLSPLMAFAFVSYLSEQAASRLRSLSPGVKAKASLPSRGAQVREPVRANGVRDVREESG
jgi:hypothetical protein